MISENKTLVRLLAAAILVLAAAVRLTGLSFGLPELFHQDEPILVNHAMALGAGGPNPRFFILPPFCMYLLFAVYAAGYAALKIAGRVPDASAYAAWFLQDPTLFYWAARAVLGAAFGTAAVWLVWRRTSRLVSGAAGLCAAFLLALVPLHVRHSHYAYTDAAVTFALTLFWFELLELSRGPVRRRDAVRAGLTLGWAVSIKYTAAYAAPAFVAAWIAAEGRGIFSRRAAARVLLFAAAAAGAFALLAPYTFLDWNEAWSQIRRQAGAESMLPAAHHLRYSLLGGTGAAFLILSAAGWIALALRRRGEAAVTLVFAGTFYAVNTVFGQPYARYVLPLVPMLCVLAAAGWEAFFKPRGPAMQTLALLLVLLFFVPLTLQSEVLFLRPDTRSLCRAWFERRVPAGSTVVVASRTYGPRLAQTADQLREKSAALGPGALDAVRRRRLALEERLADLRQTYRVYTLAGPAPGPRFLAEEPSVAADARAVLAIQPGWLVVDRDESRPEVGRLLTDLKGRLEKAAVFNPYHAGRLEPGQRDAFGSTAAPDAPSEIFARDRLGPALDVYRFKKPGETRS